MGARSLLFGFLSFGLMALAFLPFVGSVLSVAAPLSALVGVVLGGVGVSRAKRSGEPSVSALAGVVLSTVALVLSLTLALACGLCNACSSAGLMDSNARQGTTPWWQAEPHDAHVAPSPESQAHISSGEQGDNEGKGNSAGQGNSARRGNSAGRRAP